ncbi:hypothetical protein [Pseudofrankia sp. BMG5.36]|uniref:hypothetical protein n=1 Tax=Pseudofrankia sp. BMG5.36 TaxID=1834512 RepID=UPI0008DAF261|nr:hypothetical protein [Pseudofrankia sp. BMG5.36]OHV61395.1 hypothetical protein BCD48_39710 [Pseudofrankia sp. BMG5.36]
MPFSHAELHKASVQYCFERGQLVPMLAWKHIRADLAAGPRIARLYEAAPLIDDRALPAFRRLREEIAEQFEFLIRPTRQGGLGVSVTVQPEERYGSLAELTNDLSEERRLRIMGSAAMGHQHPFFKPEECDMFRALHEVFGHALAGAGLDRHGAEAAWLRHSLMFTPPLARRAMATETRGQACALLYGTPGAPPPEPKVMVLPARYAEPDYEAWR